MKTPLDPRHKKRQEIVEDLFRIDFHKQKVGPSAEKVFKKRGDLDKYIEKAAPNFPVYKINKTDLAILRLAVYELLIEKKEPSRFIVDEAIELAKEYGGDTSPSFVNGALGNILKDEFKIEQ